MERMYPVEKDYYATEYFSDGEDRASDSSDDEVQKEMAQIGGIERGLPFPEPQGDPGALRPHEEFESDMEEELNSALAQSHKSWLPGSDMPSGSKNIGSTGSGNAKKKGGKERKRRASNNLEGDVDESLGLFDKGTHSDEDDKAEDRNEELLYDPEQDQDNQNWVEEHRRDTLRPGRTGVRPLPNSDAVLNCPACMSLLCLDCQSGPSKRARKKKKGKKTPAESGVDENCEEPSEESLIPTDCDPRDLFKPVLCTVCSSEVGVYDSDEVYHFFNVLSSYT